MKRDPASSVQQSVDTLHQRACEIVGLTVDIERIRRLRLAGEITDGAALHLLASVIYQLSAEEMQTAH